MSAILDINFWAVKKGKQDFDGPEYVATIRGSQEGILSVKKIVDEAGKKVTGKLFKKLEKDLYATMNETVAENF